MYAYFLLCNFAVEIFSKIETQESDKNNGDDGDDGDYHHISRDSMDPLNKYGKLPSTGVQSKPESIKFIQIEKAFSNTQTNAELQVDY